MQYFDIACGSGPWIIEAAKQWRMRLKICWCFKIRHLTNLLCSVMGHYFHRVWLPQDFAAEVENVAWGHLWACGVSYTITFSIWLFDFSSNYRMAWSRYHFHPVYVYISLHAKCCIFEYDALNGCTFMFIGPGSGRCTKISICSIILMG